MEGGSKTDCNARWAPAKIMPRAPNWSKPALGRKGKTREHTENVDELKITDYILRGVKRSY